MTPIDLDHNATSPLDPEAFEAMRPHWFAGGNAESRHASGRAARRALITATETVARILNAHPDEVIFTSGGTEANNQAIFGLARAFGPGLCSPIEHPAVAEAMSGVTPDHELVGPDGLVDPEAMAARTASGVRFLALILAHNETGAIQPVGRLANRAREREVPVHTDAAQAVGRIPVDFQELGVATLAASAHKFGGPLGVGVLIVRKGIKLTPLLFGGGQQRGLRPGTVPVPLIVGMASALETAHREMDSRIACWTFLRDRLEASLIAGLGPDRVIRNGPGDPSQRLPQTLNVGFPGIDGDLLLMRLDQSGVRASLGSACASGTTSASPSLVAMGVPPDRLRSSVRFSLGPTITQEQIDEASRRIVAAVLGR